MKGFYFPEAVPIVVFGVVAGWAYGTQGEITAPVQGGAWIGSAFVSGFADIGPYMGIVLPFSIAASFTDMMCLVSAQKAGDRKSSVVHGFAFYDVAASLIIGTHRVASPLNNVTEQRTLSAKR